MSIRRGVNRRQRPGADIDFDFNVDFDSLEDITDTLEALGSGTIEFHPPEFEEPTFGQFLWEEVILLGLFRAEAWPEITVSECEICVGISLDVSIYATAQGKGARVCYRFDDCKEEEAENIEEPPPREQLPRPDNLFPTRPAPRFSKGGILSWCCNTSTTTRLRDENGGVFYSTSSVKCGEWVGEAKLDQEDSIFVGGGMKFETYIRESSGTRTYLREQYWVFIGDSDPSSEEVEAIWKRAQKDGVFIGCANKRNQALVFVISIESYDEFGLRYLTENAPNLNFDPDYPYTAPPSKSGSGSEDEDDMSCCKNQRDNDALLKKIYRELTKVRKEVDKVGVVTGIEDFPVTAPRYLSEESGEVSLSNIPRFQRYIVEQLDALVGQFPIKIEIKDIDPTTDGDQKEVIELPNLAEAIADLYPLILKSAVDGDVMMDFLSRLAMEVGATKNAALIGQSYAKGNAAYLGYQGGLKVHEIPGAFDYKKMLKPSALHQVMRHRSQSLQTWVNNDRNTVQGYLEKIMYAAAIIKSVHFRSDSGFANGLTSLIDTVRSENSDNSGQIDWDAFLDLLETQGFIGRSPGSPTPDVDNIPL